MDKALKQRLVGASVIIALAVVVLPMLLSGRPEGGAPESQVAEIERYMAWPGQALGYKIGQLKIRELRARAEKKLGAKFDLRAFHDEILGEGALPLAVLERHLDEWSERIAKGK